MQSMDKKEASTANKLLKKKTFKFNLLPPLAEALHFMEVLEEGLNSTSKDLALIRRIPKIT